MISKPAEDIILRPVEESMCPEATDLPD